MIELIIVIVVVGILAAVMMPRLERDPAREAAEQVAKDIRYTQHLAMVDDVYDGTGALLTKRWSIDLCKPQYSIRRGDGTAIAVDPLSKEPMDGDQTDAFDLDKRFGISGAPLGAPGCTITFDNLGRPHLTDTGVLTGAIADLMTTDATVTIGTYTITVTKETGYTVLNY